jgi:hypothetical protein
VEAPGAFAHGNQQLLFHQVLGAIRWQLEVMCTGHYAREIIVGCERGLMRLSNDC